MKTFLLPDKPTQPFLFCLGSNWLCVALYPIWNKAEILGDDGILGDRSGYAFRTDNSFHYNALHECLFITLLIWSTYFLFRSIRSWIAEQSPS